MTPEWGIVLPTLDPHLVGPFNVAEAAVNAEALGFDSVWAGDHLLHRSPIIECLTALSIAAGATSRVRIGSGVLLPALREPLLLTKQVASLAIQSGGRLALGVGLGGEYEPEWRAVGVPIHHRASATDAFLARWAGENQTTSDLTEEDPRPMPSREHRPDIWVGGGSEAAYARTLRHADGWLGMWRSPAGVAATVDMFRERAKIANRPSPQIGLVLFVNIGAGNKSRAEAESYVETCFGIPAMRLRKWIITGSVEEVARALRAYREARLSLFVLHPASPRPLEQYEPIQAAIHRSVASVGQPRPTELTADKPEHSSSPDPD